jgi:hypothetical protein
MQHTENLFRRFKGLLVTVKTVSGGIYEGRVAEITDDYVALLERQGSETTTVFLFYTSLESMVLSEAPTT